MMARLRRKSRDRPEDVRYSVHMVTPEHERTRRRRRRQRAADRDGEPLEDAREAQHAMAPSISSHKALPDGDGNGDGDDVNHSRLFFPTPIEWPIPSTYETVYHDARRGLIFLTDVIYEDQLVRDDDGGSFDRSTIVVAIAGECHAAGPVAGRSNRGAELEEDSDEGDDQGQRSAPWPDIAPGATNPPSEHKARTTYGVFFGPESPYNAFGPVPRSEQRSSLSAHLYAARRALEIIEDEVMPRQMALDAVPGQHSTAARGRHAGHTKPPQITNVVLRTDSATLARSLAESIYAWEQSGWDRAREDSVPDTGQPTGPSASVSAAPLPTPTMRQNRFALCALHDAIDEARRQRRFRTRFWHVDVKVNAEAHELAVRALEPRGMSLAREASRRRPGSITAAGDALALPLRSGYKDHGRAARSDVPPDATHSSSSSPDPSLAAMQAALAHFSDVAPLDADARELCQRLRIPLARIPTGMFTGFEAPVRRLVMTGMDRPRHFRLLFGPRWEEALAEEWVGIRVACLAAGMKEVDEGRRRGERRRARGPIVKTDGHEGPVTAQAPLPHGTSTRSKKDKDRDRGKKNTVSWSTIPTTTAQQSTFSGDKAASHGPSTKTTRTTTNRTTTAPAPALRTPRDNVAPPFKEQPSPSPSTYLDRAAYMLDAGAPWIRLRPADDEERRRVGVLRSLERDVRRSLVGGGDG